VRPEFARGAWNAVHACLGITGEDRVAVIKDRDRAEIAAAIEEEVEQTGATIRSWVMEDVVERPATHFPTKLGQDLLQLNPTASFFVADGWPGELAFRQPLLHLLADRLRCRHGHMVGIEPRVMWEGMAADYDEVFRLTHQVYEAVRSASRIEVATRLGTELSATFSSSHRWIPADGRYWQQGRWGNLPEGETFTAPLSVDGVLVGEEMGDYFARRHGLFEEPVRMRISDGRLLSVEMPGQSELLGEIQTYLAQHPCSSRVGEFAIGTNTGLSEIIGNFLQDEKLPGVHIAFGDPYAFETGADWDCPTHVDVLASRATVIADGRRIMEDGRIVL
jgi:leucyl aminopeptidase (aminopeptidase T)